MGGRGRSRVESGQVGSGEVRSQGRPAALVVPGECRACRRVPPRAAGGTIYSRAVSASLYRQRDQPDGVPPLALTGERTLPDVPEENYWFRRHLVVYQWIAARVGGLRVIDMACGEGYGSDVLAGSAASVVGVDANPRGARTRPRALPAAPTCASSAT